MSESAKEISRALELLVELKHALDAQDDAQNRRIVDRLVLKLGGTARRLLARRIRSQECAQSRAALARLEDSLLVQEPRFFKRSRKSRVHRALSMATKASFHDPGRPSMRSPLEQAKAFAANRDVERAYRQLARWNAAHPNSATGYSEVGLVLLQTQCVNASIALLHSAARLAKQASIHHWNLAAACHSIGLFGGSYLALRNFLLLAGKTPDSRVRWARRSVLDYERRSILRNPRVSPTEEARLEMKDYLQFASERSPPFAWTQAPST